MRAGDALEDDGEAFVSSVDMVGRMRCSCMSVEYSNDWWGSST